MTNYDLLLEKVRDLGMDYKWARMFVKKLRDDEEAFQVDEQTKKWAIEKGFYPGWVETYGLTEDNYRSFMPDYQYFMMHPLNNHFLKWLDKTTLKYVLNSNGCEASMPEYYLYVENNNDYTYLMDAPAHIARDKDFILNLLKEKGTLAIKPNSGTSGGLGFIKLELRDGQMYENNKPIDMERYNVILHHLQNNIVTEYCYQHHELAEIWPKSECTLRVIMAKAPREEHYHPPEWICIVSYARFGTAISGGASNRSAGGISIGFDFETGAYNDVCLRTKRFCPDGKWRLECRHPDTGVSFQGKGLPNWEYTRDMIKRICQHVSSLDYLGLDIIITEDGMKLCEINSHPAMDDEQVMCGPALSREDTRKFFETKGFNKIDSHDFLMAYMDSQE